jgi:hypothetical protein
MAEQPISSLKARIAALNIEEVHAPAPSSRPSYTYEKATIVKKKPPAPPPPAQRPSVQQRQQTVNNPPILSHVTTSVRQTGNEPSARPALPPRLPPRTNSQQAPPTLPPRKPSEPSIKRRESNESISTIASGISTHSIGSTKTSRGGTSNGGTLYQVRAPAYDPSKLPPLPPKKASEDPKVSRATPKAIKSTSSLVTASETLPPQSPARPPLPARQSTNTQDNIHPQRTRTLPPPRRSALEFGLNKASDTLPPIPTNRLPASAVSGSALPPPVPLASRPNLDAIMASKPKPRPGAMGACLKCRDFSAPDHHASQFPKQSLPTSDIARLATQLTSPFPSATDKARVIFTWLHHNVDYDVVAFYGNNVQRRSPEQTLTSGLAVCEGYASLFAALALKSGLEAVVVGGHGKGAGFKALTRGEPLPEYKPSGHAWNAVRIDNGEWKLLDACWGAGNVQGPGQPYQRDFKSYWFTMDNNEFGYKHFPSDNRYFFRTDGRAAMTWEEYWLDDIPERLQIYGPCVPEHGIGERTFQPAAKHIKVNDPQGPQVIRFSFASVCCHWDNERHGKGKPYVMVLRTEGPGKDGDWIPFNTDGKVWWVDVNRNSLGAPGQDVSIFSVDMIENRNARGLSVQEYKSKKGRVQMGPFGGVAMWTLV